MKKITLLGCVLSLLFVCCVSKKEITQTTIPLSKLSFIGEPGISSLDSMIYVCAQYILHDPYYEVKPRSTRYKDREVCSCVQAVMSRLDWVTKPNDIIGGNTLIIWDKAFVANYILPEFKQEKDREIIEYTLVHGNDSTFKNIIDYDNKVVVNDKAYYYPLKIKKFISCIVLDYEWFKSVVPQSSWIYEPGCFDDGKGTYIDLLIPLLDENN